MTDEKLHLYFRRSCLAAQQRFVELADAASMPRVFVHGNPHVDNFAKTLHGEAMIDFDRSRLGPYAWDLVRFLCSMDLQSEFRNEGFVSKKVVRTLLEGYREAYESPYRKIPLPAIIKGKPKANEKSMKAYLAANVRWAQRMRQNPLFTTHPTVQAMLRLYFRSRNEPDWETRFRVDEAGIAAGTLGKPRLLCVLADKTDDTKDPILLDLKEVYADPDTEHFFNPYVHHGLRMIEAAYLHVPGFEQRLGFLTWRDSQYWVRQVPAFKAKLKRVLSPAKQEDFAFVVGVQLGGAHRKSLRETPPGQLLKHLDRTLPELLQVGRRMNDELVEAYERDPEAPHAPDGLRS